MVQGCGKNAQVARGESRVGRLSQWEAAVHQEGDSLVCPYEGAEAEP